MSKYRCSLLIQGSFIVYPTLYLTHTDHSAWQKKNVLFYRTLTYCSKSSSLQLTLSRLTLVTRGRYQTQTFFCYDLSIDQPTCYIHLGLVQKLLSNVVSYSGNLIHILPLRDTLCQTKKHTPQNTWQFYRSARKDQAGIHLFSTEPSEILVV